ncbi:MAG: flippase [Myxococcaceae bacterium]
MADSTSRREAQIALFNALKLGASLLVTWSIALGARVVLPRHLGPEQFGVFGFADAFAIACFVLATFGLETYIQKEIPLRPWHASEFFGAVLLIRALLLPVMVGVMGAVLESAGRPAEMRQVVYLFAVGQFFFVNNTTFSALLHASTQVDGLSIVNVVGKLLWGVGIALALTTGAGLVGLAAAFIASEAFKSLALFRLCRKHVGLRLTCDLRVGARVLWASAAFFLTTLSLTLHTHLDVNLIAFLTNDSEVGWYSAATSLANLALLLTPLISSVLMPLFARAAARSEEELTTAIRRSLELILSLAIPTSLALGLGAEVWIGVVAGPGFEPAAMSLRALAPLFVCTYLAILCATFLNLLGRAWTVTWISVSALGVNVVLNLLFIAPGLALFGPGGAGTGAAIATIGTEGATCVLMLSVIGRRALDRRVISTLARTFGVVVAVTALHLSLAGLGAWRLLVDAVAYVVLALAVRAIRLDEVVQFARTALQQRRGAVR